MIAAHSEFGVGTLDAARAVPAPLICRAALALREAIRRLVVQHRRRSLARATLLTLQSLDGHTLRDLGIDRSEIPSVATGVLGEVDATRARIVHSL
jgi:uncharacterized protein YjiS (DUF1127 family)